MELMSWWSNNSSSGEVVALGWTLLHFCWQGAAIALVYAIVDRLTRRASGNVRYGIAMAAIALMPLTAMLTLAEQQRLLVQVARDGHEVMASQLGSLHATVVQAIPAAAPVVERSELWIAWNADRLLPWVVGIWLAGVLLLAVRATGGWWQLERVRRAATSMIPAEIESSFRRIASRLRLDRKVALYLSEEVISPLAMGVWRTAIILPVSAVMQLSPEQLEAVLAHEMAHVRRWDYLCNLLQTAVECLLFFHPAVWWLSRRTRDLRERCCDEVAAASCADPTIYVEALLQMETQRTKQLHLATALKGRNGSLLNRVRQLLGEDIQMERETMSGVRIGVVGAVVLALVLGPAMAKGLRPEHKSAPSSEVAVPAVAAITVAEATTPVPAATPEPRPMPSPRPVAVTALPEIAMADDTAQPQTSGTAKAASQESATSAPSGKNYLDEMRAAGYPLDLNNDLDTIASLRSVGVTPEYAKGMAQAGYGTPTLRELISLKAVGVTPEYAAGIKSSGIAPANFREVVGEKSLGVTPEYAKAVAGMGLGNPTLHDLMAMKAQGITPEYASELKASGIPIKDLRDVISSKAIGLTPEYVKAISAAGYSGLSTREIVSLRARGVTPEYLRWLKQTFPSADMRAVDQAMAFHINADFVTKAKSHGFNDASLDKLVKLKMTGLLD